MTIKQRSPEGIVEEESGWCWQASFDICSFRTRVLLSKRDDWGLAIFGVNVIANKVHKAHMTIAEARTRVRLRVQDIERIQSMRKQKGKHRLDNRQDHRNRTRHLNNSIVHTRCWTMQHAIIFLARFQPRLEFNKVTSPHLYSLFFLFPFFF